MSQAWPSRFLELAEVVSNWSKDPTTKVGAVIADNKNRIVSVGFNGFPRGVVDNTAVSREVKLAQTIHAEANAILFANRSLEECSIYVTRAPCSGCAAFIIQSGIQRVYYTMPDPSFTVRWAESIKAANNMFSEAGVEFIHWEVLP